VHAFVQQLKSFLLVSVIETFYNQGKNQNNYYAQLQDFQKL